MDIDNFKLLTARLELRPHKAEDASFMVELNSDPEVTRYVPDGPFENPHQASKIIESLRTQFVERRIGRFMAIERQTNQRIGWCGLKWCEDIGEIDLGYRFLRSAWGKGYASEAAQACLEYGFKDLGFKRITARIVPDNRASVNIAKKLGMKELSRVIEDGMEYIAFEIRADDFQWFD